MRWDPEQYLRFADARGRPFSDLLTRVDASSPAYVVDLGCGPGNLTAGLLERWPDADVVGVDSSPEMVEQATRDHARPGLSFELGDVRTWSSARPVDVLTCNATFQWVPGHLDLLPRLWDTVAPGGWFAFQVPANFDQPNHTELAALRTSRRWSAVLGNVPIAVPRSEEPVTYLRLMSELGARVLAWETTYHQALQGEDPVVEWMKGTGLRPVLAALDDAQRAEFLAEYGGRMRAAYPRQAFGTVLPYRRIFLVAQKPAAD